MQKQKTMMSNVNSLATFNQCIEDLKTENEILISEDNLVEICKANFRKLSIVKKFSKIDEDILMYELSNIKDCSADFLSGILSFETTRLRFKEELAGCQENLISQNYETL